MIMVMATAIVESVLRSPLSFFFAPSRREDYAAAYLLREHARGRSIGEIFADHYIRNRLSQVQEMRLLDRPELIHALGQDVIEAERRMLALL